MGKPKTLLDDQQMITVKENLHKVTQAALAKQMGISYQVLKDNLSLHGLTKKRTYTEPVNPDSFTWNVFKKSDPLMFTTN